MKKICIILGMMLFTVLLVYGILAYCVFFYYGPRIAKEEARREGWAQAVEEIEEETRQVMDMAAKESDKKAKKSAKEKAILEQNVKIERSRRSLLDNDLEGTQAIPSNVEWKRRTDERLARAEAALDDYTKNCKDDAKSMPKLKELRQLLEALRARQQELQDLYEKRDKLMVWPLPLIAPYFEKETK